MQALRRQLQEVTNNLANVTADSAHKNNRLDAVKVSLGASDLAIKDALSGTNDPYCLIKRVSDGALLHKTEVLQKVRRDAAAEFRSFCVPVDAIGEGGRVRVEVLDWDMLTRDDAIGSCEVNLQAVQPKAETYDVVDLSLIHI